MIVTGIEPVTKSKSRVFIDEQFAFVLYKGELSRYHLKCGSEVSEETYQTIRKDVILKRAKLRAMHLLNDMDRTEHQLRKKLEQGEYPADIIDAAMAYVNGFGYINDEGYARRFIESRKRQKSRREIYMLLCQKGLSKELIENAMEECYQKDDSHDAIEALMRKKKYDPNTASPEERQKLCAFLMRKGFRYEDIRQVIQVSEWNA